MVWWEESFVISFLQIFFVLFLCLLSYEAFNTCKAQYNIYVCYISIFGLLSNKITFKLYVIELQIIVNYCPFVYILTQFAVRSESSSKTIMKDKKWCLCEKKKTFFGIMYCFDKRVVQKISFQQKRYQYWTYLWDFIFIFNHLFVEWI